MDPHAPAPDPAALGIDADHHDGFGAWRRVPDRSLDLIRAAMGLEPGQAPPATSTVIVVPDANGALVDSRSGEPPGAPAGSWLRLEDGATVACEGPLPLDLPVGHHSMITADGTASPLLVSPARCHLPADLRIWGITAQLYAARSSRSWGVGDLGDLARLVEWATGRGASIVGLNPLHAPTPSTHPPNSPYSPSSRRWRDPSTISVESVPGFAELPDAADRRSAGRGLTGSSTIDRAAAWAAKRATLELLWSRFRETGDPSFERFTAGHGEALERWGAFCAIADERERAGAPPEWQTWPADLRRPDAPGVAEVVRSRSDEVRFWCWLQWLVDRQLVGAGSGRVVLTDMAVGFAPDGFDAWEWQDLLATGARIGAPPDPLGPDGQDWGLPPFVPWKLADAGYAPFAETLRSAFRDSLGVRIDHVMGLFRLFWLPPGRTGADGAYVRFRGDDLLHVLAIESSRAGGLVVGEDLGTVETGVRETLGRAGVLSTRLLWFEDDPPSAWPRQAQAAITTHDLPTVAGVWSGVDLSDLVAAGVSVPPGGDEGFRHRLRTVGRCDDGAAGDHVAVAAHRSVAESPCMIATATLDDMVGAPRRPNVPGTIDEHPNWRIPLPVAVDDLPGHPLAEQVAATMASARPPRTDGERWPG